MNPNKKNNLATLLCGINLALLFSVSSLGYAQDRNPGRQTGFETGKHEGHLKDNANKQGFENERNPWSKVYQDSPSGIDFDLTIHHRGLTPYVTFTRTYNSLMTVQDVITDILPEATGGYYLQECFQITVLFQGLVSDCTDGETATPIESSLTLEQAGLLDDPEVHLIYIPE